MGAEEKECFGTRLVFVRAVEGCKIGEARVDKVGFKLRRR